MSSWRGLPKVLLLLALLALWGSTTVRAVSFTISSSNFVQQKSSIDLIDKMLKSDTKTCLLFNVGNDGAALLTFNAMTNVHSSGQLYVTLHPPLEGNTFMANFMDPKEATVVFAIPTRELVREKAAQLNTEEGRFAVEIGKQQPEGTYGVCFSIYYTSPKPGQVEIIDVDIMRAFGTSENKMNTKNERMDMVSSQEVKEALDSLDKLYKSLKKVEYDSAHLASRNLRSRRTSESTFTRIWGSTIVISITVVVSVCATFTFTKRTIKKKKLI